jgi:hypothetical protein
MGKWAMALWLLAGCAHEAAVVPRFQVLGANEANPRVAGVLAEHRADVMDCFDEMADRRDVRGIIRFGLSLRVREGALALAQITPLDASSISDGGLTACLADRLARWPVGGRDADLVVRLAVAPRIQPRNLAANLRAEAAPLLVPQE